MRWCQLVNEYLSLTLAFSSTVSFGGRPGGPNFYINLSDSINQDEVDLGESCFGKVVQGQSVLDAVMDKRRKTLQMIGIQSMTILPNEE